MNEEKEYFTLHEAAELVGIKRATIYLYLRDLGIEPQKFGRDKHGYISKAELEQLRDYRARPWKYQRKQKTEESAVA